MNENGVQFICLVCRPHYMRRAILLTLIILLSQPLVSATDISEDVEADSNGTLSGEYSVKDGATWTISGDYEIAEDTTIVVEEGSTMIVTGSMTAESSPQLNLAGIANVLVPVGNLGESGTLRIIFAEEVLYGITIEINNDSTENWTGSQFDWIGGMDVDNLTVNITTHPFQISAISNITLSPQGATPVLRDAEQLSGEGTSLVIPDRANAWSIDVCRTCVTIWWFLNETTVTRRVRNGTKWTVVFASPRVTRRCFFFLPRGDEKKKQKKQRQKQTFA